MLYRGQAYGAPVGEWWTTSRDEAVKFAMSRGGNRTYVVLGIDQDANEPWLARLLYARRDRDGRGDWYRIPAGILAEHWRGVRIVDGAVSLEEAPLARISGPRYRPITVEAVIRIVASCYDVSPAEIRSDRRYESILRPRAIAMLIARRLTRRSYTELGEAFNRHHTTIVEMVRKTEALAAGDPSLRDEISTISSMLAGPGAPSIPARVPEAPEGAARGTQGAEGAARQGQP